jgi:hypothetical protein
MSAVGINVFLAKVRIIQVNLNIKKAPMQIGAFIFCHAELVSASIIFTVMLKRVQHDSYLITSFLVAVFPSSVIFTM